MSSTFDFDEALLEAGLVPTTEKIKVVNYTSVMVTMNSNMKIDPAMRTIYVARFLGKFKKLFKGDDFGVVFGNTDAVKSVDPISSIAFEKGSIKNRFHIHFTIRIKHFIPRYSLAKLRLRLQQWINGEDDILFAKNWHVWVQLLFGESRGANYTTKNARWEQNDEVENDDGMQSEIDRLCDDFNIVQVNTPRGPKRILNNPRGRQVYAQEAQLAESVSYINNNNHPILKQMTSDKDKEIEENKVRNIPVQAVAYPTAVWAERVTE